MTSGVGARAVRRPRRASVAGGRQGERGDAELAGTRHADGGASRLERACGQKAFILDAKPSETQRPAERGRFDQRRIRLAEGDNGIAILVRQ